MSKIDRIEADIEITKAELNDAKRELAKAVLDQSEDVRDLRAYLISLQNTLTEQQREKNLLLASQGKFTLLSMLIDFSDPLHSTFLTPMMTYNA